MSDPPRKPKRRRWRWFIVALLLFSAGSAGMLVVQNRSAAARRQLVLTAFTDSFRSGLVTLTGEPVIESLPTRYRGWADYLPYRILHIINRWEFNYPEDYRITAPVKGPEGERIGCWRYSMVSGQIVDKSEPLKFFGFGYSEADPGKMPALPPLGYFPPTRWLVDGRLQTSGAEAKIISLPAVIPINQQARMTIASPAGTTCKVYFPLPGYSIADPAPEPMDAKGQVTWVWNWDARHVRPDPVRGGVQIIIQCNEPVGTQILSRPTTAITHIGFPADAAPASKE